jgi:membrane protein DedA with SNARE-associated domain
MDIASLIQNYGYLAVVVGCLLEGETALALAGFAARMGHLKLHWVVVAGAFAGFAGDQFWFWLGRRHGDRALARFPRLAARARRFERIVERHPAWLVPGLRFAYGLRIAGPIVVGASALPAATFALYNALGAVLWAGLVVGFGWVLGDAFEHAFGRIKEYEVAIMVSIVALGAVIALVHAWRVRRGNAQPPA